MPEIPTKPYLLRAIYEWCTDNGYTPYLATKVDSRTRVPREFVKNGEIVLNISFSATSGLKMENDLIEFHARFGGVSREISIPVDNIVAIYARENGQGMAFEATAVGGEEETSTVTDSAAPSLAAVPPVESEQERLPEAPEEGGGPPKKGGRPTLTRIK